MVTPLQKKWFRIEQDAGGAILSCEEVDSKGRKGAHVRYYEALDKAQACSDAVAWYEKSAAAWRIRYEKRRADPALVKEDSRRATARRDAAIEIGVCSSCRLLPLVNKHVCAKCRDRFNENRRRRLAGLPALRNKPKVPREQLAAKALARSVETRANFRSKQTHTWGSRNAYDISCVLTRFDTMTPAQFRRDLVARILKNGGAAAANALAEYEQGRAEKLDRAVTEQYKRSAKARRRAA